MSIPIEQLKSSIQPTRAALLTHPVYSQIKDFEGLKKFAQYHVFAVWDFMSLLKSLQIGLTCVQLPWVPVGSANTRFLINEIVAGEESDVDEAGNRISHFELYLDAMNQIGANTLPIHQLTEWISYGKSVEEALYQLNINEETKDFVRFTFSIIESNELHKIAAVFTFGREDLIPDMFIEILREMKAQGQENISKLLYYLERHIEIDGDDHGPISLRMMEEICGDDANKWEEATLCAKTALEMRIKLWNGLMTPSSSVHSTED